MFKTNYSAYKKIGGGKNKILWVSVPECSPVATTCLAQLHYTLTSESDDQN